MKAALFIIIIILLGMWIMPDNISTRESAYSFIGKMVIVFAVVFGLIILFVYLFGEHGTVKSKKHKAEKKIGK